tara:strand:- start:108082 stop:108732 length:651 start_codon:yes stop_codon:yes gene_type:complete
MLKKMAKKLLLTMTVATALTANVNADDIRLGEPGYGGSGCPSGSASVTLSPDAKALSIIFDEYMAEAGQFAGKRLDRKNCNLAIPVHVPQGFSISIIDVDYRGYNSIPRGGMSRFSAEYFFAGKRGPRVVKNFRGPVDDEYIVSNKIGVHASVWSPCGKDVNLRVNTSMLTRTNRRGDDALSTVDTADFTAGILYKLQWKRCKNEEPEDDFYPWGF